MKKGCNRIILEEVDAEIGELKRKAEERTQQ